MKSIVSPTATVIGLYVSFWFHGTFILAPSQQKRQDRSTSHVIAAVGDIVAQWGCAVIDIAAELVMLTILSRVIVEFLSAFKVGKAAFCVLLVLRNLMNEKVPGRRWMIL